MISATSSHEFRLGELFSGPGGLAHGAFSAVCVNNDGVEYKMKHGWSSDYDKDSCDTYAYNILNNEGKSVFCEDVKELDVTSLPQIDAFAYGFPCNDFSLVGEQKGVDGKFGPLYTHGIRVLNHFNPKFFVAENVGGLSSANGGKALTKILKALKLAGNNGYELTVHKYKSEQYGVAQTRHRVIIVGINKDEKCKFEVPAPTVARYKTAKEALTSPPIPVEAKNQELTRQSATVIERLTHTKPGENAWNANLPDHVKLNVKGAKLSQIYKRLDPDKPSYTITGSGGGGTHCYHWDEPRALTNRERARLQSFPDEYFFQGSKESVRKQVGMAVPPELSRVIFEAILKTFAGVSYDSVSSNIPFQGS